MNTRFFGLLIASCFLSLGLTAHAAGPASFTLNDTPVTVERGEWVDLTVQLAPNGASIDTARLVLEFDPTLLSAQSVRLDGTLNRLAPGNYRDNANGIVSWGAFTLDTPLTSTSDFVTITFLALQEGETQFSIGASSRAISEGQEMVNVEVLDTVGVTVLPAAEAEAGVALLVLESETHPDQEAWSTSNTAAFTWTVLEGDSTLSALYYAFDRSSDTDPSTSIDPTGTFWSVGDLEDGTHYFHLKGAHADGRETPVEHYRINVDTTAPNPIELVAQDTQVVEDESVWLTFATTDETSGVLQYQIAINESDFQVQQSPLEITDLDPGTYFFRVAALDRAGNVAYEGQSVRIYPEGTELERPEGYEENTEIGAVGVLTEDTEISGEGSNRLLTIVLVLIAAIGLGYAISRKHTKQR